MLTAKAKPIQEIRIWVPNHQNKLEHHPFLLSPIHDMIDLRAAWLSAKGFIEERVLPQGEIPKQMA